MKAAAASVCLALLILYTGVSTEWSFTFSEVPGFMRYDMLAEALLAGQLHLKQPVDPGRLSAPDPLNPLAPYPFMFDALIWNGKYYFQHEPLPAVFHAIWIKLTGFPCRTGAMVILGAMGTLLCLGVLLLRIREVFFPDSPWWLLWFVWLTFALSGLQLYMVKRPVVYHEATALGMFFVSAGFTSFVYGITGGHRAFRLFALAGVLFGAAVACRPSLVFYPFITASCYLVSLIVRRELGRRSLSQLVIFSVPVCLAVGLLLGYNYMRFGSFFDFGREHLIFPNTSMYLYLTVDNGFFRSAHVTYHLHHYLFAWPKVAGGFPFLFHPWTARWIGDVYIMREAVCSIFIMMPVLTLLMFTPLTLRDCRDRARLLTILAICGTSFVAELGFLSFHVCAAPRYIYDFVPVLFVVVFCNVAVLWPRVAEHRTARIATVAGLGLLFALNGFAALTWALAVIS